jgi:hypothetical protein
VRAAAGLGALGRPTVRLAVLTVVLLLAVPATAQDIIPNGGAAGGPALMLPHGDILNVRNIRNIQGGIVEDPNLDIGAGSTAHPGDIALNFDVGRCVRIFDGRKHLLARFCPHAITFYVKPKVRVRPVMRRSGTRARRPQRRAWTLPR